MVLALAIVDDIGAIVVIAIGYSGAVSGAALASAALGFGLCALLNRMGVRGIWVYLVVGSGIWLAFVLSGVHPTVAGVALGLLTPSNQFVSDPSFMAHVDRVVARLRTDLEPGERRALLMILADEARETVPPLERLEIVLHPWVAFGIMPLFALANAGVHVNLAELGHPVENAVMAGLVVGKPVGIFLFSYVFVRLGIARLPAGVTWPILLGGGFLGGIGFTMALFIADLALAGPLLEAAKIGILTGSALAAVAGSLLLVLVLPRRPVGRAASGPPTGEELENWDE
jgi:NhaA family Na+:H+ antiporter